MNHVALDGAIAKTTYTDKSTLRLTGPTDTATPGGYARYNNPIYWEVCMLWTRSGRMHWTSVDAVGKLVDVRIINGIVTAQVVDMETGEIVCTKEYKHPLDVMTSNEEFKAITASI